MISVDLSESLTKISDHAFSDCSSLEEANLPEGILIIEDGAYSDCKSLANIKFPDSIVRIGGSAFARSDNLSKVVIPNNVVSIGEWAFVGCPSLVEVIIPENVKNIGEIAFGYYLWYGSYKYDNGLTIRGVPGSTAEKYAKDNEIRFVDINAIEAESISLNKTSVTIDVGKTETLTVDFAPENTTETELTWETSNNRVATVDNGVITAVESGTATITAKTGNGKTATCEVTVNRPVTAVSFDDDQITLAKGESETLYAYVSPYNATDKTLTWETSDANVATVTDGRVTAVNEGKATITAKSANGITASCEVIVTKPYVNVEEISISETDLTLKTGDTKTLIATVTPDNATDKTVTWTTSDDEVATVKDGKVTAVGAGTATITARTENGLTARCWVSVENPIIAILSADLSDSTYTYDGTAKEPNVTVKDTSGNTVATENYTITYSDNTNAGTATVTVTGKGNYSGTITKTFTINKAKIDTAAVTVADQIYTGKALTPAPTVKIGDITLKNGTDYSVTYANNTNAGTATVTITGKGNYTGTITKTFTISPADMANFHVELSTGSYTYDGTAKEPTVTVKDANGNTVAASNYTVTYKNNTNAGTATVSVTGKGNYTGTITKTFTISPAGIANFTATLSATSYTYTGTQRKPSVKVTNGSTTLKSGTDYTVTYSNNTNKGTATVKITGKGNYSGTITKTFTIKAKAIKTAKLSGVSASYKYTGKAQTPTVTLKDGTKTLKKGTDYTVTYKNNKAIGTATITIKGKGNYSGTVTKTFKIVPKTTTLKTVTSPKTKQLKATWTKDTTVTGYQIQYSTSSTFKSGNKTKTITKNSTTSATIGSLTKGKTYYVRIRSYKKVGNTTFYGSYSTVKKVKIK